jgi:sigma-B regulation protein RsbU (phosphoserine phosphatase)
MTSQSLPARPTDQQTLETLFDLGRQVTSVLDLDALLQRIPELVRRLLPFEALAVFLLDDRKSELRIAYSVGYPDGSAERVRLKVGQGLVGTAVATGGPILHGDVEHEKTYVEVVPGMHSTIVVPLRYKSRPIGALNILSAAHDQYDRQDVAIVSQFGVHVAVALANAASFERERRDAETFETLAEIGRELSSILDLDVLLERIGHLAKRVVDYRTFGILLLEPETQELVARVALRFGVRVDDMPHVKLGDGIVGFAALHRQPVLVPDVREDSRYIKVLEDVRTVLAVPMLVKDRCIGVIDLESPEVAAFDRRHVYILTMLASQASVAVENARLYETVRANEKRLEKEVHFAQRVQRALLPAGPPKRMRGIDVAARLSQARELGGDFYDFLSPEASSLVVAIGDVSGKGVPAALYGAFAAELVRSRTFRRRYTRERTSPADVLASINTILHQRQLEAYFCTLCYLGFDMKRRVVTIANSGLPYPLRVSGGVCEVIELPGIPLGTFEGTVYDELTYALHEGDTFVACSDGVLEASPEDGEEFGRERLTEVLLGVAHLPAAAIVDAVYDAVERHAGAVQGDDMTAVAVKITA